MKQQEHLFIYNAEVPNDDCFLLLPYRPLSQEHYVQFVNAFKQIWWHSFR